MYFDNDQSIPEVKLCCGKFFIFYVLFLKNVNFLKNVLALKYPNLEMELMKAPTLFPAGEGKSHIKLRPRTLQLTAEGMLCLESTRYQQFLADVCLLEARFLVDVNKI